VSLYLAVTNFCWKTNGSQEGLFGPKMERKSGFDVGFDIYQTNYFLKVSRKFHFRYFIQANPKRSIWN
jgi:hypothetical protein